MTLTYTTELVVVTCWCGTPHAVPEELRNYQTRAHRDGMDVPDIYCPLGHAHVPAGKSKYAIEREAREAAELEAANARESERIARAEVARLTAAATKARKRAEAGICPHCKRSFVNMARHVATKHPVAS